VTRADGAATFEISTGKKTYYLTADSIAAMEDWIRVLQNVQRRNATKLLLHREEHKPTIQGWLTKVKNGHTRRCWCVLIGKMFMYFKGPTDTVLFLISNANHCTKTCLFADPVGTDKHAGRAR
jgi:pleckstrin homology domain-containing family H